MLNDHQKIMLADAFLELRLDEAITGYLFDVRICCCCAQGRIYNGWGYRAGEQMTSGEIRAVLQYGRHWAIKTVDGDCLALVSFARGGRQSLNHLIDLFQTARLAKSRWCLQ